MNAVNADRTIAVTHRVKLTEAGEARPTLVSVSNGVNLTQIELMTEQDELDFVNGVWPTGYRKATPADKPADFRPWHQKWQGLSSKGKSITYVGQKKHEEDILYQVPSGYDGLRSGDTIIMALGGSGDRLAAAMARQLSTMSGMVCRIAPWAIKDTAGSEMTQNEALFLLWEMDADRFYMIDDPELKRIAVREAYENRREAQLARMGCGQRLLQREIGKIFLHGNLQREVSLEDSFESIHANSPIMEALIKEENQANRLLDRAVKDSPIWQVFEPVEGVGPAIAGALIAAIGDIRRFATYQKLFAFSGLHPLSRDGKKFAPGDTRMGGDSIFPRRRRGQLSNWNQFAKQAFFLLGDQFNRRPQSYWGTKLRQNKIILRQQYPEVVVTEQGKKRYTDGHIHKLATWKTIRQFARWLYRAWTNLENGKPVKFPVMPVAEVGSSVEKLAA